MTTCPLQALIKTLPSSPGDVQQPYLDSSRKCISEMWCSSAEVGFSLLCDIICPHINQVCPLLQLLWASAHTASHIYLFAVSLLLTPSSKASTFASSFLVKLEVAEVSLSSRWHAVVAAVKSWSFIPNLRWLEMSSPLPYIPSVLVGPFLFFAQEIIQAGIHQSSSSAEVDAVSSHFYQLISLEDSLWIRLETEQTSSTVKFLLPVPLTKGIYASADDMPQRRGARDQILVSSLFVLQLPEVVWSGEASLELLSYFWSAYFKWLNCAGFHLDFPFGTLFRVCIC